MKTILVTGGAGFIGSHFILKLLDNGYDVICVDVMNEYYDVQLKKDRLKQFEDKIKFYKTDIANKDELEKIFKENKIDKICNFAAQAGVRYSLENPFIYAETNYVGTLNLFELAKRYKINHIIHASTSSIYGLNEDMPFTEDQRVDTPISIYSATKRGCELLAHSYNHLFGLNITCLRFFTVYGPFGRPDMALFKFTKNILDDKPIDVYNNGDMTRDFTYVKDIVEGFFLALEKPMGYCIINIGNGNPTKLMDYVKFVEENLGKKAKINFMGMQPGDVKETSADISKAKELLGYEPKVNVEEGVKHFIDWYKDYYGVK
jgi:UDP-glucuronate 4-epimerase